MAVHRKSVEFDPAVVKDNLFASSYAVFMILLIITISFIWEKKTIIDWVACFGLAVPFIFICLLVISLTLPRAREGLKRIHQWRKRAVLVETELVDFDETGFLGARGYDTTLSMCSLALRLVADQQAVCPGETVVWASVRKNLFRRYVHRRTARIYYLPADPLAFFIEGELYPPAQVAQYEGRSFLFRFPIVIQLSDDYVKIKSSSEEEQC